MKRIRDYLLDILHYLDDIAAFTTDGKAAFLSDRKTQLAVIRAYEVIGEIVKRIPESLLETQPHIDWRAIKGFRDVLIHQYDNIDLEIVWTSIEDVPNLRAAVTALLDALPDDDAH